MDNKRIANIVKYQPERILELKAQMEKDKIKKEQLILFFFN